MKDSVRLTAMITIAAVFAFGFGFFLPELTCLPSGQAFAQEPPDITLGTTKVRVTYETANECLSGPVSCASRFSDSDSYEVNANVNATGAVDLDTDVTHNGLSLQFIADTCANISNYENLLSWQVIPGNAIHKNDDSPNWTIYSFAGNVPTLIFYASGSPMFDHLEMNLRINKNDPTKSSLHVKANTNFCFTAGRKADPYPSPVSMIFDLGLLAEDSSDSDTDFACVDLTPQYSDQDISSAYCPLSS